MKNGHCPKCNSSNIYRRKNGADWGNGIVRMMGVGFSQQADCDSYVCIDCGYFENYISDMNKLRGVPQEWIKVI